jgi:enterochelin esterase-like enzyme
MGQAFDKYYQQQHERFEDEKRRVKNVEEAAKPELTELHGLLQANETSIDDTNKNSKDLLRRTLLLYKKLGDQGVRFNYKVYRGIDDEYKWWDRRHASTSLEIHKW